VKAKEKVQDYANNANDYKTQSLKVKVDWNNEPEGYGYLNSQHGIKPMPTTVRYPPPPPYGGGQYGGQYGGYDKYGGGQYGGYDKYGGGQYGGYDKYGGDQYGGYEKYGDDQYGGYDKYGGDQYGGYEQNGDDQYGSDYPSYGQRSDAEKVNASS